MDLRVAIALVLFFLRARDCALVCAIHGAPVSWIAVYTGTPCGLNQDHTLRENNIAPSTHINGRIVTSPD